MLFQLRKIASYEESASPSSSGTDFSMISWPMEARTRSSSFVSDI